jgi:hypothetical protein
MASRAFAAIPCALLSSAVVQRPSFLSYCLLPLAPPVKKQEALHGNGENGTHERDALQWSWSVAPCVQAWKPGRQRQGRVMTQGTPPCTRGSSEQSGCKGEAEGDTEESKATDCKAAVPLRTQSPVLPEPSSEKMPKSSTKSSTAKRTPLAAARFSASVEGDDDALPLHPLVNYERDAVLGAPEGTILPRSLNPRTRAIMIGAATADADDEAPLAARGAIATAASAVKAKASAPRSTPASAKPSPKRRVSFSRAVDDTVLPSATPAPSSSPAPAALPVSSTPAPTPAPAPAAASPAPAAAAPPAVPSPSSKPQLPPAPAAAAQPPRVSAAPAPSVVKPGQPKPSAAAAAKPKPKVKPSKASSVRPSASASSGGRVGTTTTDHSSTIIIAIVVAVLLAGGAMYWYKHKKE